MDAFNTGITINAFLSFMLLSSYLAVEVRGMRNSRVLLISLDGFRWDYLQIAAKHGVPTPNFNLLIRTGSSSIARPSYVTTTFPNHITLVSGLHVESHGIVGNIMKDPKLGTFKAYRSGIAETNQTLDPKWMDSGAEPIWVTNQKRSVTHKSGVYFWPGCGSKYKGILPSFYKRVETELTSFTKRIDTIVDWFVHQKINLGVVYFEEPDATGHTFGPDTKEVATMIGTLDSVLGHLIWELERLELFHLINIIITSDHGMIAMGDPQETTVELDKHISRDLYDSNYLWPVKPIWPKPGMEEKVLKALRKIPHLTVYTKDTIPDEYHYRDNPRLAPIQIESDPGYLLLYDLKEYIVNKKKANSPLHKGTHGYTNRLDDMLNIFIAHGPMFKQGYTSKEIFPNVDVYPLLCHVLGLTPAPNNGSLARVEHMLFHLDKYYRNVSFVLWNIVTIILIFGLFVLSGGLAKLRNGEKDCCESAKICRSHIYGFKVKRILMLFMVPTYLAFTMLMIHVSHIKVEEN